MKGFGRAAARRITRALALTGLLGALLAGCGGGASVGSPQTTAGDPQVQPLDDPLAYSAAANASLAAAAETVAVSRHTWAGAGTRIELTARAGHLIARHAETQAAQAALFYVAYTADVAAPAQRPVTFFYNGGPGSASVWLHLGSFAPRRLATGMPSTAGARPYAMVPNAESLIDTTDLVFIDAVGTGLSQAITPYTNRNFWGVDADAALFRDGIRRWLDLHGRRASPVVLFGESYGGPRTAVLARLLEQSGLGLAGVILQSPAMDYNSNCGVLGDPSVRCTGYLATYGQIGAWHALVQAAPTDADAWAASLRSLAIDRYAPALQAWQLAQGGVAFDGALVSQLAAATGIDTSWWLRQPNLMPDTFQEQLLPGALIGRYDGRVNAPLGSELAREGDPSSTVITDSFRRAIATELRDTLGYRNASTYVLLSNAIAAWDFRHAGRELPDTVPDLAEALRLNPRLQVLSMSGYHDLATPFHLTELDLARLAAPTRVRVLNYPGGHMSYLSDATRVRQKADLVAFYRGAVATAAAAGADARKRAAAAAGTDRARVPDAVGVLPALPQWPVPQQALQRTWREPWVPPMSTPPR